MRVNNDLGIFDFDDFAMEMTSTELLLVNGGGGGGNAGSDSGGSSSSSSGCGGSSGSDSGGGSSSSSSCGGASGSSSGSSSSSVSSSCGGSSSSYSGGGSSVSSSCGGSSSSYCGGGSSYTPSINLPDKQVCIAPKDFHCDIYAWNLAIDNGLDPSVGNKNILDLNKHTVDTMYNTYYKDKVVTFDSSAAGKKGVLVYDWGGTSSAKDHVEFVEIASDGRGYTLYITNGIDTPVPEYRSFSDYPKGRAGAASTAEFIAFN